MRALILALLAAGSAEAQALVPVRTIPPRAVVAASDLAIADAAVPGALTDLAAAVGMEARVALYPGRPIRAGDLGPPALVERNALVPLVFRAGGLVIVAEGRALDRAGAGEAVRVMNLASRVTVTARMGADGMAHVSP
jgi:flagella basal body P-ring formation protein FlgA